MRESTTTTTTTTTTKAAAPHVSLIEREHDDDDDEGSPDVPRRPPAGLVRPARTQMVWKVILHLDLDAFYCQVEHKRLGIPRDVPLAVRQWQGLIAVNYPARAKGVGRFCDINEAIERCHNIELVHVETLGNTRDGTVGEVTANKSRSKASLARYRRASFEVIKVMQRFSSQIERASIDEVYIDVTSQVDDRIQQMQSQSSPEDWRVDSKESHVSEGGTLNPSTERDLRLLVGAKICKEIRDAIKEETEYEMSAGISHNKMLSKLASAMNKPNKQTIVPMNCIQSLMAGLEYKSINGLGGKLGVSVQKHFPEAKTALDLQRYERDQLAKVLGDKTGAWLHELCRGTVDDPVKPNLLSKSLNACKSFEFANLAKVREWMKILAAELVDRVDQDHQDFERTPTTLVLHARSALNFKEHSSQGTMPGNGALPSVDRMFEAAMKLYQKVQGECLPCSRLALGVNNFVTHEKDQVKVSSFFAASRGQGLEAGARAGVVATIATEAEPAVSREDLVPPRPPSPEPEASAKEEDGVKLSDISVSEQRYILSMIRAREGDDRAKGQASKKKRKVHKTSAGQRSLAQFWKRK